MHSEQLRIMSGSHFGAPQRALPVHIDRVAAAGDAHRAEHLPETRIAGVGGATTEGALHDAADMNSKVCQPHTSHDGAAVCPALEQHTTRLCSCDAASFD